jgi:hypothetical protein
MIKLEPNVDIKTNLMDEQLSELPLNKEVEVSYICVKCFASGIVENTYYCVQKLLSFLFFLLKH